MTSVRRGTVEIVNKLGLHARAAAKLVTLAKTFAVAVELGRPGGAALVDAKSIMAVLMLEAVRGTELVLVCEGPDEDAAFEAVTTLVANRFGEEE